MPGERLVQGLPKTLEHLGWGGCNTDSTSQFQWAAPNSLLTRPLKSDLKGKKLTHLMLLEPSSLTKQECHLSPSASSSSPAGIRENPIIYNLKDHFIFFLEQAFCVALRLPAF